MTRKLQDQDGIVMGVAYIKRVLLVLDQVARSTPDEKKIEIATKIEKAQ